MRLPSLLALSTLQLAATACRPARLTFAAAESSYVNEQSRNPSSASGVKREELLATGVPNLRDALNRTRPEFLRSTSSPVLNAETTTPVVYVDGRAMGGPDVLQLIQVAEVAEVRLLRPTVARALYGSGCACAGGVIAVTRWNGR